MQWAGFAELQSAKLTGARGVHTEALPPAAWAQPQDSPSLDPALGPGIMAPWKDLRPGVKQSWFPSNSETQPLDDFGRRFSGTSLTRGFPICKKGCIGFAEELDWG